MDKEDEITITKFQLKETHVYVKITWREISLHIELYHDHESWSGEFSDHLVKQFSSEFDEDEQIYFNNVKRALLKENIDYLYEFIRKSDESATFIWKKKFPDGAILKYGSVDLRRGSAKDTKECLIDYLINENDTLLSNLKEYRNKNDLLHSELEKCKKEWEDDVKIKLTIEQDLYGKFVKLLNSKKKRIQILEECIKEYK